MSRRPEDHLCMERFGKRPYSQYISTSCLVLRSQIGGSIGGLYLYYVQVQDKNIFSIHFYILPHIKITNWGVHRMFIPVAGVNDLMTTCACLSSGKYHILNTFLHPAPY